MYLTAIHMKNENKHRTIRHLMDVCAALHKAGVNKWATGMPKDKGPVLIVKGRITGVEKMDGVEKVEYMEVETWN